MAKVIVILSVLGAECPGAVMDDAIIVIICCMLVLWYSRVS
jgi:hypothetical protein